MYVVVVGSRNWQDEQSQKLVNSVLDQLYQKYSGLVIVSSSCDQGVGCIVKSRCLKDKKTFQLVEYQVRLFVDLPRSKLAQVHKARNAALEELGEVFHVFVDDDRRGTFEDLIERLQRSGRGDLTHIHYKREVMQIPAEVTE